MNPWWREGESKKIILDDQISPTGMAAIARILKRNDANRLLDNSQRVKISPLWDTTEMFDNEELTGTMVKRLSKAHKIEHDYWGSKCSWWQGVLDVFSRERIEGEFSLEFTQRLCWSPGDYGDHNSCFWNQNKTARDMLAYASAWAVLIKRANKGYGRAWIVSIGWNKEEFDPFVVFNGYAMSDEYNDSHTNDHTRLIASLIASVYEVQSMEVHLVNQGYADGKLYINGGRGFLIGNYDVNKLTLDASCDSWGQSRRKITYSVDLHIRADVPRVWSNYIGNCKICGAVLTTNTVHRVAISGERNDWQVCYKCYGDLLRKYTTCTHCNRLMPAELQRAIVLDDHCRSVLIVCKQCAIAEKHRYGCNICDSCGMYFGGMIEVETGYRYCNDCVENYVPRGLCVHCGNAHGSYYELNCTVTTPLIGRRTYIAPICNNCLDTIKTTRWTGGWETNYILYSYNRIVRIGRYEIVSSDEWAQMMLRLLSNIRGRLSGWRIVDGKLKSQRDIDRDEKPKAKLHMEQACNEYYEQMEPIPHTESLLERIIG